MELSKKELTGDFVSHINEKPRCLADWGFVNNRHAAQHDDREGEVPERSNEASHDMKHDESKRVSKRILLDL